MWGSDVSLGLKLGQISIKWDKYGILKVFSTLRFAKNTYFIQKHVFYAKTHILCKKTYFMQKHIFMSKHIFYAKKTYFMQKHIFHAETHRRTATFLFFQNICFQKHIHIFLYWTRAIITYMNMYFFPKKYFITFKSVSSFL